MTQAIEALMAKGAWAEAKAESEKLVSLQPACAEAQAYLGICHFREQQWELALSCFQRATTLNPKYWQAGLKIAQCLDRLLRLEDAYETAAYWQSVHPNDQHLNFLVQSLKRYERKEPTDGWQKSKYKPDHHVTFTKGD